MFPAFLENLDPDIYLSDNYIGIDFETTNDEHGHPTSLQNRIVCWVAVEGRTGIVHRRYVEGIGSAIEELLDLVQGYDYCVAHNAKFELAWLYRLGLPKGRVLFADTMLAEKCILGNLRGPLDLDSVAHKYGVGAKSHFVAQMVHSWGICPSTVSPPRLLEYCEQDVSLTLALWRIQRDTLKKLDLLPVFYTRCLTTNAIADIELQGLYVDAEKVRKEFVREAEEAGELYKQLAEVTGGINPKSPKQVAAFLYDTLGFEEPRGRNGEPLRTAKGGRKTDSSTIATLKPKTEKQRKFVRSLQAYIPRKKRLEFITKAHEAVKDKSFIYVNINQHIAASHRTSSSGRKYKIQSQNIDRDYKQLFVPRRNGFLIGEADAPQLEFRVAAELGNDPVAKKDIRSKFDVHRHTAAVLNRVRHEDVTSAQRTAAKPRTFAPLYGANSGTPDEKRYNEEFRTKYNALNKTQIGWTYEVLKSKQMRIPSGLIFYWPDVKIDHNGYINKKTEIFNYPIQSFATADIIPISLVYMWYRLLDCETFIINTVHDSVICEIHPDEVDKWKEICELAFTHDTFHYLKTVYGYDFGTPLGVEYHAGKYWGDGKPTLFEVDPQKDTYG